MATKRKTDDDADDTETDDEEMKETNEEVNDFKETVSEEGVISPPKKARTDIAITEEYHDEKTPLDRFENDATATKEESPCHANQSHEQGDEEGLDDNPNDTEVTSIVKFENIDNENAEEGPTNVANNDETKCNQGKLEENVETNDDETQPPVQAPDTEANVKEEIKDDVSVDTVTQTPAQATHTAAVENERGTDDENVDPKEVDIITSNNAETEHRNKRGEKQKSDIHCENERDNNDMQVNEKGEVDNNGDETEKVKELNEKEETDNNGEETEEIKEVNEKKDIDNNGEETEKVKEVNEKRATDNKGEETEKVYRGKVGNCSIGEKNDEDTKTEKECDYEMKGRNNTGDDDSKQEITALDTKTNEKNIYEKEVKDEGNIEVSESENDDNEESAQRCNDGQAKGGRSKTDEKREGTVEANIAPRPEDNLVKETPLLASNGLYGGMSAGGDDAPVVRANLGRRLTFPEKLMELLNSEETQNSMCWIQAGNACALHQTLFVKNILPIHFEGTKFESFTRKLNRWGFKRIAGEGIPENAFAYSHHLFKRDYPELCRGMSGGKKVEQDFSHLIRYRELARRFPDNQASMPSAMAGGGMGGGMSATMNGNVGSGMVAGMGGGIGAGVGVGTSLAFSGGMSGGMNGVMSGGMGGVMGGGMGNGMAGVMGGLGSRYPSSHGGDTLQSLEVENLLLERQINMGGTSGGSCAGLGSEHDLVFRKALLRQEAAVVREQRLEQQLMMERMLREHQGSSVVGPGGYMGGGGGGHNSGDNSDGDHRRAAYLAREQAQIAAVNAGSGVDRMFHREGSLGVGSSGGSRSGSDMERQQLHIFAERQAMHDRQTLQERMAYFGNVPGQSSYLGNSSGGMYSSHGLERSTSEQMLRDEEEAATRIRIERRLMQEVAMREQQGLSSMGGAGVGRYHGGM